MGKNIILVDDTIAEAADVNEMGFQRIISDATPSSTSSTTYVTKATLAVPATEVKHHIWIVAEFIGSWSYNSSSGNGHSSQYDILIGESGSEVSKKTGNLGIKSVTLDGHGRVIVTIPFYYEPTTLEKTNGFNVLIKIKTTNEGTGADNYAGYNKCDIFAG